jgi:hypothetical protein
MAVQCSLEGKILTALKAAVADDRLDVAEHLICALETLEREPSPGSALGQAYMMIVRERRDRRRPRRMP